MKTLRINRAKWLSADFVEAYKQTNNYIDSSLLNSETGRRCCLGFAVQQCRVPLADYVNIGMPSDLGSEAKTLLYRGFPDLFEDSEDFCDSKTGDLLAKANDDKHLSPERRERKIISLFKKIGVRVVFYGDLKAPKVEVAS